MDVEVGPTHIMGMDEIHENMVGVGLGSGLLCSFQEIEKAYSTGQGRLGLEFLIKTSPSHSAFSLIY